MIEYLAPNIIQTSNKSTHMHALTYFYIIVIFYHKINLYLCKTKLNKQHCNKKRSEKL